MKSNNFWVDKLADLIDEGFTSDEAVNRISVLISKRDVNIRVGKVITEFKKIYGMTPTEYEFWEDDTSFTDLEDEFLSFKK